MPSEFENLISELENETVDIQKLGGMLVWMEMTVRRALDTLQQTGMIVTVNSSDITF